MKKQIDDLKAQIASLKKEIELGSDTLVRVRSASSKNTTNRFLTGIERES